MRSSPVQNTFASLRELQGQLEQRLSEEERMFVLMATIIQDSVIKISSLTSKSSDEEFRESYREALEYAKGKLSIYRKLLK